MKRKQKELPLDDVIRQFVKAAQRVSKDGGYMRVHIEVGSKDEPQRPAAGRQPVTRVRG